MNMRSENNVSLTRPTHPPNTLRAGKLTFRKTGASDSSPVSVEASEPQRIIIVSHSYAPWLNPRAFRWTAIAERWAQEGAHVVVVCAWGAGLPVSEIRNQVHVHRVGSGIVESLRSLLRSRGRNSQASNSHTDTISAKNNASGVTGLAGACQRAFKSIVRTGHDLTWKNIYWPDYAALWAKPATRKVNAILDSILSNTADADVTLITVSDPFTSHVVGRAVKRQRADLNWIVDIGDPFCFRHDTPTNNHRLYRSFNYRYESKVFAEANSVSVTTEATKRRYVELFPLVKDKIFVIPPLVSLISHEKKGLPLGDSVAFKALFTGALYRQIRNPEPLLQLFCGLRKKEPDLQVELHFFGLYEDCKSVFGRYKDRLGDSVRLHGLMSRDVTSTALNQADLLINIGNTSPYQLPSKVVEYACTSKPILNLACIAGDSSAEFFAGRPRTLTINVSDGHTLNERVTKLGEFILHQETPVPRSYRERVIKEHSATTIAACYKKLFAKKPRTALANPLSGENRMATIQAEALS